MFMRALSVVPPPAPPLASSDDCGYPLREPFAAIALTLFALCIFAVCWLGRVGREAAPGTWPRRPWLVRCFVTSAVSRFLLLLLLGLLAPMGICDGAAFACGAIGEVGSGVAFGAAWSGSLLVLNFLMELRLAYINTESEAREEHVQTLRRCTTGGLLIGGCAIIAFRTVSIVNLVWHGGGGGACGVLAVHDPHSSWVGQACHAALTGAMMLLVVGFFLQPPLMLHLLVRLALLQWPRRGPGRMVLRWLLVILALILASAGRFVADVSTAMQLSWAMKFLRWTSEEGVAYFFLLGALPELMILAALGEEVHTTRFTKFGSVPWLLRVPISEVSIGAEVGEGAFARVYAGSWRGGAVALKRLKTDALIGPRAAAGRGPDGRPSREADALRRQALQRLEAELEAEAALLCKAALRHNHILRFIGLVVEPGPCPLLRPAPAPPRPPRGCTPRVYPPTVGRLLLHRPPQAAPAAPRCS